MNLRTSTLALILSMFGASILGATQASAATCENLISLQLHDTTITAAQSIRAGTYTAPDGEVFPDMPAFCRVAAMLTPTSDSDIGIEIWMPASTWNEKFQGVGNGGFAGSISYAALASNEQANAARREAIRNLLYRKNS
jgi:feruloyl esterase